MEAIGSIYTRIHTINVLDSILLTLPWSVISADPHDFPAVPVKSDWNHWTRAEASKSERTFNSAK